MLENESSENEVAATPDSQPAAEAATKPIAARRTKGTAKAPAKRVRKAVAKPKVTEAEETEAEESVAPAEPVEVVSEDVVAEAAVAPVKKVTRTRRKKAAPPADPFAPVLEPVTAAEDEVEELEEPDVTTPAMAAPAPLSALFVAPVEPVVPVRAKSARKAAEVEPEPEVEPAAEIEADVPQLDADETEDTSNRRRRGRRGRGKARTGEDAAGEPQAASDAATESTDDASAAEAPSDESADGEEGTGTKRRRRRRRRGEDGDDESTTSPAVKSDDSRVKSVTGSVRLEAKRQRRREGRDAGRRRAPILTEAEFLARRESVDRTMLVRQVGERTQIAVIEDDVLVEHYVTRASTQSFAGGIYLGRVQNVLPSMEAAFVDIGKRRNAVLYAGEVNWDEAGLAGKQRNIEQALKSGDKVLVQVTKDPIGHKGARLTSQISLPGRYLVYVPGGSMTGISRKLPDTERTRLKEILRKIVPEEAGVIIRTAAEGASEEELTSDVRRLTAQWEVIQKKAADSGTQAPSALYEEPDLAIRVVRDLFNEDFASMVVSGNDAWDTISAYIEHVAPDLAPRLSRWTEERDVFAKYRVDEQLLKALDRKVFLPSGGSLVIDHTEAMTVIDVNTGKFTGSGGNLEQTVTRNNLESAEEIVRQLRLRDVGGIVVIDFIDMILESNRELVLRRLTECLGRDRTKHQVAEVTSLGLVQMTRKRVGQGLLDAFSEPCEHCHGRGVIVHTEPVDRGPEHAPAESDNRDRRSGSGGQSDRPKSRRGRGRDKAEAPAAAAEPLKPFPMPAPTPAATAVVDAPTATEPVVIEAAAPVVPEVVVPEVVTPEVAAPVAAPARPRRRAASRPAGPPAPRPEASEG